MRQQTGIPHKHVAAQLYVHVSRTVQALPVALRGGNVRFHSVYSSLHSAMAPQGW